MDTLANILQILHFIGIGVLIGGFLTQTKALKTKTAELSKGILHGSLTMLVTGLALVGIYEIQNEFELNNIKIGVKTLVVVAIVVLSLVNQKKKPVANWVLYAIAGLTVLNIILAVTWH